MVSALHEDGERLCARADKSGGRFWRVSNYAAEPGLAARIVDLKPRFRPPVFFTCAMENSYSHF